MPVETPSMFAKVIEDHLELKKRNSDLSNAMRRASTTPTSTPRA